MQDPQEHDFSSEFDDVHIVISLDMGIGSASMKVTISAPDNVQDEIVQIPTDDAHFIDTLRSEGT